MGPVYRKQLIVGLTVAFAAMSVWFVVLAITFNPLILAPALLFGVVAYFMWYHASGRLAARIYRRAERVGTRAERARPDGQGGFGAGPRAAWERPGAESRRRVGQQRARTSAGPRGGSGPGGRRRQRARADPSAGVEMGRREAASVLGVEPSADDEAVRAAYRDRIKEVHPDAPDGDEDSFKRVRDAYERLSD